MKPAYQLFNDTMIWLRDNYSGFCFFTERDVVWIVQTQMCQRIIDSKLPYKVFNDYPMIKGNRRSLSTDLAILDADNNVQVAIEFKYEPDHRRGGNDIIKEKFPVVSWSEVGKDIERIYEYIAKNKAQYACSIFVDEGGAFHHRPAHPRSEWMDWKNDRGTWVLYAHTFSM